MILGQDIPTNSSGEILIPRKDKLLQLFPNQREIIERLTEE